MEHKQKIANGLYKTGYGATMAGGAVTLFDALRQSPRLRYGVPMEGLMRMGRVGKTGVGMMVGGVAAQIAGLKLKRKYGMERWRAARAAGR